MEVDQKEIIQSIREHNQQVKLEKQNKILQDLKNRSHYQRQIRKKSQTRKPRYVASQFQNSQPERRNTKKENLFTYKVPNQDQQYFVYTNSNQSQIKLLQRNLGTPQSIDLDSSNTIQSRIGKCCRPLKFLITQNQSSINNNNSPQTGIKENNFQILNNQMVDQLAPEYYEKFANLYKQSALLQKQNSTLNKQNEKLKQQMDFITNHLNETYNRSYQQNGLDQVLIYDQLVNGELSANRDSDIKSFSMGSKIYNQIMHRRAKNVAQQNSHQDLPQESSSQYNNSRKEFQYNQVKFQNQKTHLNNPPPLRFKSGRHIIEGNHIEIDVDLSSSFKCFDFSDKILDNFKGKIKRKQKASLQQSKAFFLKSQACIKNSKSSKTPQTGMKEIKSEAEIHSQDNSKSQSQSKLQKNKSQPEIKTNLSTKKPSQNNLGQQFPQKKASNNLSGEIVAARCNPKTHSKVSFGSSKEGSTKSKLNFIKGLEQDLEASFKSNIRSKNLMETPHQKQSIQDNKILKKRIFQFYNQFDKARNNKSSCASTVSDNEDYFYIQTLSDSVNRGAQANQVSKAESSSPNFWDGQSFSKYMSFATNQNSPPPNAKQNNSIQSDSEADSSIIYSYTNTNKSKDVNQSPGDIEELGQLTEDQVFFRQNSQNLDKLRSSFAFQKLRPTLNPLEEGNFLRQMMTNTQNIELNNQAGLKQENSKKDQENFDQLVTLSMQQPEFKQYVNNTLLDTDYQELSTSANSLFSNLDSSETSQSPLQKIDRVSKDSLSEVCTSGGDPMQSSFPINQNFYKSISDNSFSNNEISNNTFSKNVSDVEFSRNSLSRNYASKNSVTINSISKNSFSEQGFSKNTALEGINSLKETKTMENNQVLEQLKTAQEHFLSQSKLETSGNEDYSEPSYYRKKYLDQLNQRGIATVVNNSRNQSIEEDLNSQIVQEDKQTKTNSDGQIPSDVPSETSDLFIAKTDSFLVPCTHFSTFMSQSFSQGQLTRNATTNERRLKNVDNQILRSYESDPTQLSSIDASFQAGQLVSKSIKNNQKYQNNGSQKFKSLSARALPKLLEQNSRHRKIRSLEHLNQSKMQNNKYLHHSSSFLQRLRLSNINQKFSKVSRPYFSKDLKGLPIRNTILKSKIPDVNDSEVDIDVEVENFENYGPKDPIIDSFLWDLEESMRKFQMSTTMQTRQTLDKCNADLMDFEQNMDVLQQQSARSNNPQLTSTQNDMINKLTLRHDCSQAIYKTKSSFQLQKLLDSCQLSENLDSLQQSYLSGDDVRYLSNALYSA